MDWSLSRLSERSADPSGLLQLPPEIRDVIYEFALTSDHPVVTFRLDTYQQDSYQEATQPPLTRVSRQVRQESLPIYFDCNEFILHAEGSKVQNAHRWLICNSLHLPKLRHLSFWVRYVTLRNDRNGSSGALSIGLRRDVHDGCWKVKDRWKWITVVRRPAALDSDAKFLIAELRRLLINESTSYLDADEWYYMLTDLNLVYVKEKMS